MGKYVENLSGRAHSWNDQATGFSRCKTSGAKTHTVLDKVDSPGIRRTRMCQLPQHGTLCRPNVKDAITRMSYPTKRENKTE